MKRWTLFILSLATLTASRGFAQSHIGTWVHRNSTDTTVVQCRGDVRSTVAFPPSSMQMGMMYPDSIYCQFSFMPMDSLHHPFDSTFLGWRRIQVGSDSSHFGYMHCDPGYGTGNYMMGFQRGLSGHFFWDSTTVDSLHRGWHLKGVRCWNGSGWTTPTNVSISGSQVSFVSTELYSAIAQVGEPAAVTSVQNSHEVPTTMTLSQNYPNPFNPTTTIQFSMAKAGTVVLEVYNLLGQKVKTLVDDYRAGGTYSVTLDASNLSSGMYFYRLETDGKAATRSLTLVR